MTALRDRAESTVELGAARRALRAQIARLERVRAEFPVTGEAHGRRGPRVLALGELERERDRLVDEIAELRELAAERDRAQRHARARLEAAIADPRSAKWLRISNRELGLPGCTTYSVRPCFALLGLLLDWWVVKVSSGCPL